MAQKTAMVTGALSLTGRHITERLIAQGVQVRTLTNHPQRPNPFGDKVQVLPYSFADSSQLEKSLAGITTFYITYWVRFDYGKNTYQTAVANTQRLFQAAKQAGVQRVVYVSIANPSEQSPLPYYSGKALLERNLAESGLSHAILRPTVLFGEGAVLINNIAWLLRKLPFFAIIEKGDYKLQPVHVEDLADLAVKAGNASENTVQDAVGPETFTYLELVSLIRKTIGSRSPIVHLPRPLAYALGRMLGWVLGDVLITREEVIGLMENLLISHQPSTCPTSLTQWLAEQRENVGKAYLSELKMHYR